MSFRMSRDLARSIATALLAKKKAEIEKFQKQFTVDITARYKASLPKEVLDTFKKFPGYFNTTENIKLHGPGFGYNYERINERLPEHNSERGLHLKGADATTVKNAQNEIDRLHEDYNKLHTETVAALIGLNSAKRIEKEFPEALKFIPVSTSQALYIDIPKLRERIK